MTGGEIMKIIREKGTAEQCFIKWWRKEEDFIDFDLIERFESKVGKDEEFGGFELISMQQMWDHVKELCSDRLSKTLKDGEEVVVWTRGDKKSHSLPYKPKTLLDILDFETKGNYVD